MHLYVIDLVGCCHLDLVLVRTRCMFEPVLLSCCCVPSAPGGRWHPRPVLAQEHAICSVFMLRVSGLWTSAADRCHLAGLAVTCLHNRGAAKLSEVWSCFFAGCLPWPCSSQLGSCGSSPHSSCLEKWTVCGETEWENLYRIDADILCWCVLNAFLFVLAGSRCREERLFFFFFSSLLNSRFNCWKGS